MTYAVIEHALGSDFAARALQYALDNAARFQQSGVGTDARYDPAYRESRRLDDVGVLDAELRDYFMSRAGDLATWLGMPPFVPDALEMEVVAHGDGAYFRRHIDTFTGGRRESPMDRVISAVYYFHAEPKVFSGGALRLFPLNFQDKLALTAVEIQPERDRVVAFPSWLPHEVAPVTSPSKNFADARLSINCWLLRARG